jgi:hypothetical protein
MRRRKPAVIPMATPISMPPPSCSIMNWLNDTFRATAFSPASAIKNNKNGTDSPSLRPASTFNAWRIFIGTRGLCTITCPRPASVGARMAARMPASHKLSRGKMISAARRPTPMVNNIPILKSRAGRFRMLLSSARSVPAASAKSRRTSPISAM